MDHHSFAQADKSAAIRIIENGALKSSSRPLRQSSWYKKSVCALENKLAHAYNILVIHLNETKKWQYQSNNDKKN